MNTRLTRYLPILTWGREYTRSDLGNDLTAAFIVTIMLIPQSLAYALLAGLPAEAGLYASICSAAISERRFSSASISARSARARMKRARSAA